MCKYKATKCSCRITKHLLKASGFNVVAQTPLLLLHPPYVPLFIRLLHPPSFPSPYISIAWLKAPLQSCFCGRPSPERWIHIVPFAHFIYQTALMPVLSAFLSLLIYTSHQVWTQLSSTAYAFLARVRRACSELILVIWRAHLPRALVGVCARASVCYQETAKLNRGNSTGLLQADFKRGRCRLRAQTRVHIFTQGFSHISIRAFPQS